MIHYSHFEVDSVLVHVDSGLVDSGLVDLECADSEHVDLDSFQIRNWRFLDSP